MGTPHKHAELIKAWADGAEIELLTLQNGIAAWAPAGATPNWTPTWTYRVKVKPQKPNYGQIAATEFNSWCYGSFDVVWDRVADKVIEAYERYTEAASGKSI